ncbi:MAG: 4Fe-4S dicluster domain-containing protein [Caldilineae bacterium]|nr:MAG: 4Fe-4S dicluster domain-containing protein [Caldilineae bacterium]
MANSGQKRYAFVIELDRCIGCDACMVSCSQENSVPIGKHRNWVIHTEVRGTFPELVQDFLPGNCMHCSYPPCVYACPTGASYQREDGLVLIDQDICIGCRYCMAACPYDARYYDEERGVVDKCSACVHRLDAGQPPACVETCVGGARHFGDLNDPESDVAKLVATGRAQPFHPETDTDPMVYYMYTDPAAIEAQDVEPEVSRLTHVWQKLEKPVAAGLIGASVVVTGLTYGVAHRNAQKHFAEVAKELAEKETSSAGEKSQEPEGSTDHDHA